MTTEQQQNADAIAKANNDSYNHSFKLKCREYALREAPKYTLDSGGYEKLLTATQRREEAEILYQWMIKDLEP